MKGLWMGSSFCAGRGGDQVMDIYLCGMGLSGRAYHEEPKGASSKKRPRCPYRKIKKIKNRGHNMSSIIYF